MQEQWGSDLETVISVLQVSLAPAFLLAAIASLLNVYTGRLSRIVDRGRQLRRDLGDADLDARAPILAEMHQIRRRKKLVRLSLLLTIGAAVVVCLMVGILFIMGLTSFSRAEIVIAMFALSMALLAISLAALLAETGIASHEADLNIDEGSDI
ncbi:MAG: DUF2721 domain-containing protein [Sphingomonadales bacterium]